MNSGQTALVSIKTFSDQNLSAMKSVVRELKNTSIIKKISSVYKVSRPAESLVALRDIRKEEHLECYAAVAEIESQLAATELLQRLKHIEKLHQKEYLRRSISLNLLLYAEDVVMSPELSLPHPEMHLRPEEIVLATEIAGSLHHPVLKENLARLAQKFAKESWGEFFAQGKSLFESERESI